MVDWKRFRRALAAPALLLIAGCGALAPSVAHAPREPLSPAATEAIGFLLRLEDHGEFDADVLNRLAGDAEPEVRIRTAYALGRIGGVQGRQIARRLVLDTDTAVAAAAASAIGVLRDSAAVSLLTEVLGTGTARRPTVAAAAAEALGEIATPEARDGLLGFLGRSSRAGGNVLAPVATALQAVSASGESVAGVQAFWLQHADPEVRASAAGAIAGDRSGRGIELLLPLLTDPEPRVRAAAAAGIATSDMPATEPPSREAVARLPDLAKDTSYTVRITAIRSLAAVVPEAATEILLTAGDPHSRLTALKGLVRHHPGDAVVRQALLSLAEDRASEPSLRAVAVEELARLNPSAVPDLARRLEHEPEWQVRAARARLVASLGSAGSGELLALVRDTHPRVSVTALHAAVNEAGPAELRKLRPLLLEQLHSADPSARAAASRGLGRLADPSTLPFLLDAFERSVANGDSGAALHALEALASLRRAGAGAPERALFVRVASVSDTRVHARGVELFGDAAVRAWGATPAFEHGRSREDYVQIVEQWIAPPSGNADQPILHLHTAAGDLELTLDSRGFPLETASFLSLLRNGHLAGLQWTHVLPGSLLVASSGTGDSSEAAGYFTESWSAASGSSRRLGYRITPDGPELVVAFADTPLLEAGFRIVGTVVGDEQALKKIMPGDRIISIQEVTEK